MAIEFTLKIEDDNIPLIKQTFGATLDEAVPGKILEYLLAKVTESAKLNAYRDTVIDGDEIEIDED